MNSYAECKEIIELNLDPIKVKLMHQQSGEGWTPARADAVELEYRRFLYLRKAFPSEDITPLQDVDTFWHYHILDTMKYARDCQDIFGSFLHHFPYSGLRGEDDLVNHQQLGDRTRELYGQVFGDDYYARANSIASAATAWCNIGTGASRQDMASTAWCNIGTGASKQDTAATAWCNIGTGASKPGTARTAWCNIGTGTSSQDTAATARCNIGAGASRQTVAPTAWCNIGTGASRPDTALTAWCNIGTGASRQETAPTAWCNIGTGTSRQEAAPTSWCNIGASAATQGAASIAWCNTGSAKKKASAFLARLRLQTLAA